MIDREKVIRGLECCIMRDPDDHTRCSECPYESTMCGNRLKIEALALLKAQRTRVHGRWIANDDCGELECPICGGIQIEHGMFCTWCGAKMSGGVQDDD